MYREYLDLNESRMSIIERIKNGGTIYGKWSCYFEQIWKYRKMHKKNKWRIKEAFEILLKNNYITQEIFNKMKGMIGFRNIAVHDYQDIDEEILIDIIENHLEDLTDFARDMLNKNT